MTTRTYKITVRTPDQEAFREALCDFLADRENSVDGERSLPEWSPCTDPGKNPLTQAFDALEDEANEQATEPSGGEQRGQ